MSNTDLRLSVFIRKNRDLIIAEWEAFARTILPEASRLELSDHAKEILDFVADDIETFQTRAESAKKSYGDVKQDNKPPQLLSAAENHADERRVEGFNILQIVSEYRALRASVIRLWTKDRPQLLSSDVDDLTRFDEAIDEALAESVASFTKSVEHSRDLFLGILGHDIRNPLGAILMLAELVQCATPFDTRQHAAAKQIADCSLRIGEIIDQLIDVTRTRLGSGIAIRTAPMDIAELAETLVKETRARFPNREILLHASGNMRGDWDHARLGQVFSNLLGNAVQYSTPRTPISVSLAGDAKELRLTVHNEGVPIASSEILTIFDSLTRTPESEDASNPRSTNLGLGLYIAKEIVLSHGGTIAVTSSASKGTAFMVVLPRI